EVRHAQKVRTHFIPQFASQAAAAPRGSKETFKPSMNWMTSGKHRALYSQRGRRRQMHFPSQVQHQRVMPTSPSRSSQPRVRDSAKPWYIVSIGDDDESQDIRVLELERKSAMSAAGIDAEEKVRETARVGGREDAGAPSSPRQKRGREQEQSAQDGRSENRCIFTPVKKTRKYEQPPGAAQLLKSTREERPPSSIASGVDMLFFNDGEELSHKNRALRTKQVVAEPVPQDAHINRLSQHISDTGEHDELRVCDAVIPVDAKERILAATASQAIRETSPNWYSRPTMTNPGNATSTQAAKSTAFQQSWVMSSRTKTILDAVSSSKASSMENAIEKRDTKYLEMESVAIYMYTLVQCYKIDVKLRFVHLLL
ncbi:hypothetical protein JG688_00013840, partial [Phytophthora aleatoria]